MAEVKLQAAVREGSGKGAARRARATGQVPAIVYGRGMEPLPITVDRREFVTALHTDAGMNVLLDIHVNGETILALTREIQTDPVRNKLLHADFVKVDRQQEVEVDVPVHLVGDAPGVKEGGVLEHPLNSLHVRCQVTEVPEAIEADISALNIGDQLRVADLSEGRTFHILNEPDSVVASISAPISEEQLAEMEAATAEPVEEAPEPTEEAEAPTDEAATEAATEDLPDSRGT